MLCPVYEYGHYPGGDIYNRPGPNIVFTSENTTVINMLTNKMSATFNNDSRARLSYQGKPLDGAIVYSISGSEKSYLGKTDESGSVVLPTTNIGNKLVFYRKIEGWVEKITYSISDYQVEYAIDVEEHLSDFNIRKAAGDQGVFAPINSCRI